MRKYAVVFKDDNAPLDVIYVMFFDADDPEHAREQAADAEPTAEVLAVAVVPDNG